MLQRIGESCFRIRGSRPSKPCQVDLGEPAFLLALAATVQALFFSNVALSLNYAALVPGAALARDALFAPLG